MSAIHVQISRCFPGFTVAERHGRISSAAALTTDQQRKNKEAIIRPTLRIAMISQEPITLLPEVLKGLPQIR